MRPNKQYNPAHVNSDGVSSGLLVAPQNSRFKVRSIVEPLLLTGALRRYLRNFKQFIRQTLIRSLHGPVPFCYVGFSLAENGNLENRLLLGRAQP